MFGGTNHDRLKLFVRKQAPLDALRVVAEGNGDQFIDRLTRTANVSKVKVELDRVVD